jgi:hypothetical protein
MSEAKRKFASNGGKYMDTFSVGYSQTFSKYIVGNKRRRIRVDPKDMPVSVCNIVSANGTCTVTGCVNKEGIRIFEVLG